jgi:DNA helicase II / ATP-dependent DNA helicase PcrA
MDGMKLTDEQVAILDAYRSTDDNILMEAYAGSGKSTMLELVQAEVQGPCLYIAFGKLDADMFGRYKDPTKDNYKKIKPIMKSTTVAKTFNGLGHGAWAKTVGRVNFQPFKMTEILKAMFNELRSKDRQHAWDQFTEIKEALGMARHIGYIPDGHSQASRRLCDKEALEARLENKLTPFAWQIVDAALRVSIKAAYDGLIDYDDQIYMSGLFGGSFPRFPDVLIDEDQDLSPTNHAMLSQLCKGSRVGAVGDRWQSIYYFRGAETGGVDKIKAKFNMTEFPLSVSFRCPQAIVEAARWRVPNLKWVKDGGRYEVLSGLAASDIPEGATIVCRNNAPLLRAAFSLLSGKRSVQVVGSDISAKIVKLLRKIGAEGDSQEDLLLKIDAWRDAKLATSNAPATTNDTAECLKVFAGWGKDVDQACKYAEHIFKQQGAITLTTGHKAKGKEWDIVYHLDSQLLGRDDQDLNLKYVIQTRSADVMYEITTQETLWQ